VTRGCSARHSPLACVGDDAPPAGRLPFPLFTWLERVSLPPTLRDRTILDAGCSCGGGSDCLSSPTCACRQRAWGPTNAGPAPPPATWECWAACGCGAGGACGLRASQGRRAAGLALAWRGGKGWACVAVERLAPRTFVAEYAGG
jgi:hypothetical protein